MDIKEIDLRRSDFEAMHPIAKLFNFDHEKLTYFGDAYDDAKRLNDLWSTWCACVALLYLETNTAKAQAVPNTQALHGRLLVKSIREHVESHITEISVNDLFDKGWLAAMKCIQNNMDMLEAQEPANS